MFLKTSAASLLVIFGLAILFTSILKSASIQYSFSLPPGGILVEEQEEVNYELAHPGRILPDSPLWFLKVTKDKVWLTLTPNKLRKAELNLLFADERLVASKILFEKGEYEVGTMILLKAQKYLEEASFLEEKCRAEGYDTREFLIRITMASLKHREEINDILVLAPGDARPEIVRMKDITREVFVKGRNALQEVGEGVPKSPSEWD